MASEDKQAKVLIVDADPIGRDQIGRILRRKNYVILQAGNGERGWELFEAETPEIVFTEFNLSRMNGQALIDKIKNSVANTGVVMFTNEAPEASLINLMRYDRLLILRKPIEERKIDAVLSYFGKNKYPYAGPENRKFRRVPTDIIAVIENYGEVKLVNLSVGGLFANTDKEIPAGSDVDLEIPTLKLKLSGTIVWQAKGGIGIRFTLLQQEQISVIGKFIYRVLKEEKIT